MRIKIYIFPCHFSSDRQYTYKKEVSSSIDRGYAMPVNIYIDQGHNPSGVNAGAEGFGVREQDITYEIGQYLAGILSQDDRFALRL